MEVLPKDDLADGCGAELQHVLVCVPCFASLAELVEYREGDSAFVVPVDKSLVQNMVFVVRRCIHLSGIVPNGFGPQCWRQILVDEFPSGWVSGRSEDWA